MSILIKRMLGYEPDKVWEIIGAPGRVDWVPGVTDCEFDGEVRTLELPGAGRIKERILKHHPETRTIEYSCFESPIPLESHQASIQINVAPGGCEFIWKTTVKPESNEKFIRQSMEGALVQLSELLGESS